MARTRLPIGFRWFAHLLAVLAVATAWRGAALYAAGECQFGKFFAEYYTTAGNANRRVFTSCEDKIWNDWGTKGATNDIKGDSLTSLKVGPDDFRVTWTGRFSFQNGLYTFVATADDGIKVRVDGEILIDEWQIQPAREFRKQKQLTAGIHSVDVEYFQAKEAAVAKLSWDRGQ